MTVNLLNEWTIGICEFIKHLETSPNSPMRKSDIAAAAIVVDENKDNRDDDCLTADATNSLAAGPVFCYAFYSLLRMNEYIQTQVALLVPLWKSLCKLAEMVVTPVSNRNLAVDKSTNDEDREGSQEEENDADNDSWRLYLPRNILCDAIRVLSDFLHEGRERLELEASKRYLVVCEGSELSKDSGNSRIIFQGKLIGFMANRITDLLKIYFAVSETNDHRLGGGLSPSLASGQLGRKINPLLNRVWGSLLGLRGMAAALQLLHSTGKSGKEEGKKIEVSVLKVYCEIAEKVGKYVTDTILQEQHRSILIPGLESLLLSNTLTQGKDFVPNEKCDRHNHKEDMQLNVNQLSVLARAIGKVSILQQILEIATSNGMCCRANIAPLLATMEHLHSTSVPHCFSVCVIAVRCCTESPNANTISTPASIVLRSLKVMIRTLREIELSLGCMISPERDLFHRVLVRWLGGDFSDGKKAYCEQQKHPLSRELILFLLHIHVLGYGNTYTAQGNHTKLLSYMAKLLMNPRTTTNLRRNVGALLIRVQSSPTTSDSSVTFDATRGSIEKEFAAWLNKSAPQQRQPRKRKRLRSRQQMASSLNQQDVIIISRVLNAGRGMQDNLFSSTAHEYHQIFRRELKRLSSDCKRESPQSGKALLASADRNCFLLAWLEKCIAMGPKLSFEFIRQATGLDLLIDIVNPVLSTISDMKFKLGRNGDSTELIKKKVLLYRAAIQLSTTWTIVFGDDGEFPLEKICLLIKHSVSKDPWQLQNTEGVYIPFVQKQQAILKFEVLNLLRCIGKAIPNNCSERILKVSLFLKMSCKYSIIIFLLNPSFSKLMRLANSSFTE